MSTRGPLLLDGRALLDADRLLRAGVGGRRTCYELWFARLPAHTGFLVVAGVEDMLETLGRRPLVDAADVDALRRAGGFSEALLERLEQLKLTVDVDAVPEGTIAFSKAPVVTVEGPFLETVLVGTIVRSTIQRATAIATRAARLHVASGGDAIIDGSSAHVATAAASLAVARAAHVGGCNATTNVLAAAQLRVPFRGLARVDLGALTDPADRDAWGGRGDELAEMGLGDDEEALLLEAKRLGGRPSGWIARGLADVDARALPLRYELVALESDGAWLPRRGASGKAAVIPGRKMVVRYSDDSGHAVVDVIHLNNERMQRPKSLGASTLAPLSRPVIRGGRALEALEPPSVGRERALAARSALPAAVTHLRAPASYPVRLSPGIVDLRE